MEVLSNSGVKNSIRKFVMFGQNYSHQFIAKVWSGSIAAHLQSKFDGYYDSHGSTGVMTAFFCGLSQDNQDILIEWIEKNYKG